MAAVARKIGSGSEISTSPGRDLKSTSELVIVFSPLGLDRIPRRQLHARAGFGKHALVAGVELLRHHPPGCPSGAYSYVRDAPSHDKTKPPLLVITNTISKASADCRGGPHHESMTGVCIPPACAALGVSIQQTHNPGGGMRLKRNPLRRNLVTAHTLRCGRRDSIAAAPKSLSPMATIPPSRARHPDLGSPAVARIPFFPLVPSPMEAVEPLESQQVDSATFCQDR
ncbi:hypothetical protein Purlil1_6754 [Purpureocillium lilacinum]|uniref:Uncharacterized protein n=1 Tax=Purpureocillium lilacinum TaxID=33203 RepID=A0ABR0BXT9_PURLI|nr:hypothetical protein Purlil1_6754 [Purpureocillium lilacinum]